MAISGVMVPITLFVCVAVVAFPFAIAFAKRIERNSENPLPAVPPDLSARMERMEHALDSIAVEVERIAEGQRFTTKLLSGRATPDDTAIRSP